MPPQKDPTPNKAELAAAARMARRAVQEAHALRENLARRKTQSRARATPPPAKGAG